MQAPTVNLSVLVEADWDDDASVWVATSADVPGLVVEHADFRQLQSMVLSLIPTLLIENNMLPMPHAPQDVPVHIAASALAKGRALVPA